MYGHLMKQVNRISLHCTIQVRAHSILCIHTPIKLIIRAFSISRSNRFETVLVTWVRV